MCVCVCVHEYTHKLCLPVSIYVGVPLPFLHVMCMCVCVCVCVCLYVICGCVCVCLYVMCVCACVCVFVLNRPEDHCGRSGPVSEEAIRCDDPDSVLPECVCADCPPALHGEPAAQVCILAHQHKRLLPGQRQPRL